jgi:hypothetical protein
MQLAEELSSSMACEEFEATLCVLHIASTEQHNKEMEAIHEDRTMKSTSGD